MTELPATRCLTYWVLGWLYLGLRGPWHLLEDKVQLPCDPQWLYGGIMWYWL